MRGRRNIALIALLLGSAVTLSGCGVLRWVQDVFSGQAEEARAMTPSLKPYPDLPYSERFDAVRKVQLPRLTKWLERGDLAPGHPVYLRLFKQESELELWMAEDRQGLGEYRLLKTYDICKYSGELGPKLKEGDHQSPEGFYRVTREALNPKSSYHLSFNLGFPNALDAALGRSGSFLMIHGGCDSIGCYAMTDEKIEEIYTLMYEALARDDTPVPVHIFPFRMTSQNFAKHKASPHIPFWTDLAYADQAFFKAGRPPQMQMDLAAKRYRLPTQFGDRPFTRSNER